jgi:hypothetical protein
MHEYQFATPRAYNLRLTLTHIARSSPGTAASSVQDTAAGLPRRIDATISHAALRGWTTNSHKDYSKMNGTKVWLSDGTKAAQRHVSHDHRHPLWQLAASPA